MLKKRSRAKIPFELYEFSTFSNMAACTGILRVLSQCRNRVLTRIHKNAEFPIRYYAAPASKFTKRVSKEVKPVKVRLSKEELELKWKDKNKDKPYGLTALEPTDDVYILNYYRQPVYEIETALEMLKKYQQLDFTDPKQPVYINLKLNMSLDKKKTVDPFIGTLRLPYPFTTETKKVLMFTENAEEAKLALENGAAIVGGGDLIQPILDDEIQADFYVAVPGILPKLTVLKDKLRKQFPKSSRGSVGIDIPKMLELFKHGHEYMVDKECFIVSQIATVDMSCEQIVANSDALIKNVCSHKPQNYGPFVERGLIHSATSEALGFNFERFLPRLEEEESNNEII